MTPPTSFILCDISISYPKRKIFDIFEQKKICIVESIEFMLCENEDICHASVYVFKWYNGKISKKFVEQLQIQRSVEFMVHNQFVWKIIPTPLLIKKSSSQKWFQRIFTEPPVENETIVVKIKPKPNHINDVVEDTYISEEDIETSEDTYTRETSETSETSETISMDYDIDIDNLIKEIECNIEYHRMTDDDDDNDVEREFNAK